MSMQVDAPAPPAGSEASLQNLRSSRLRSATRTWWLSLISFPFAIAAWQMAAAINDNKLVLPGPWEVAKELVSERSTLIANLKPTAYETVVGFLIALAAGVLVGVVLGNSRFLQSIFMPFIVVFQLVPKVALAPLFIVWFGFGNQPKILLTVLISFFPIVINAFAGVQSMTSEQRELAALLRFSRWKTFRHIQARVALPALFNGLKVAITLAVIGAVVAEFVAADRGLGYLLVVTQTNLNTPLMFAAVVLLTAFGAVLYALVVLAERLAIPWHVSRRADR